MGKNLLNIYIYAVAISLMTTQGGLADELSETQAITQLKKLGCEAVRFVDKASGSVSYSVTLQGDSTGEAVDAVAALPSIRRIVLGEN